MQNQLKKAFYWLRWILFLPASILIGLITYLLLENTIYPNNLYFSDYKFGERTVFPFAACLLAVLVGAFTAPRYKVIAAAILFAVIVLLYPECLLLKRMGLRVAHPSVIIVVMQCLGALKGLMIVVRYYYPYEDDL